MQTVKPIKCGGLYSINNIPVVATSITKHGGLLKGMQIIRFNTKVGARIKASFKATQWPDGTIFRIVRTDNA